MKLIELGSKVRDVVSGFEGIATARVHYINGCVQYGVQGPLREGKLPDCEYLDQGRLEVVEAGAVKVRMYGGEDAFAEDAPAQRPGGPQRDVPPR